MFTGNIKLLLTATRLRCRPREPLALKLMTVLAVNGILARRALLLATRVARAALRDTMHEWRLGIAHL